MLKEVRVLSGPKTARSREYAGEALPAQAPSGMQWLLMRELIRLVSSAGTGYTYYTSKNKRTTPDKLKFIKYDPKARKRVEFTEAKMPNPKK